MAEFVQYVNQPHTDPPMKLSPIPFFFLLASFILLQSCRNDQTPSLPNVIIILSDDQGWGDLSIHGNTNLQTPHIDGLATGGATLENFYVCAVCSPTRAELLTGRYHHKGGVYSTSAGGERLDLDETTMAEVFRNAGYRTAAYGKWHNGMQYPYHPNGRGFEDFYGFCSGHWGNYFSPMLEHNGKIVEGEGYVIDDFTDHGLAFMEAHRDEPFFLYLPYNTPHTPFQVPDSYWDEFKDQPIVMRSRHDGEVPDQTRAALAMCENIDWNVGRIIEKTRELGIEENTIVLYFCDNGPNTWRWNGGMKGRKGSTDEGGVRSPLFVKWPAVIPEGTRVERLASVIDLLPTLAAMCGIPLETARPVDGIDLTPGLKGELTNWEDRYILNHWSGRISVRNQQYRLSHDGGLYDITADREQKNDLSDELPRVREEMQNVAGSFRSDIEKELPVEDLRPFYLGHPEFDYTQVPARDGTPHGGIERSNRYPNCSFFTSWTSLEDSITWKVEVPSRGRFRVTLYYTCREGDEGSLLELSLGGEQLQSRITVPFDPPLTGMERDRYPRIESYVKEWAELDMGTMELPEGEGILCLKALEIPGDSVIDFRLLQFEKAEL